MVKKIIKTAINKIKNIGKGKEVYQEVPTPPEEDRLDPRELLYQHKRGFQILRKLELEWQHVESDYADKALQQKLYLEDIEEKLLNNGYAEEQLIENKKQALAELKASNYKYLGD